MYRHISFKIIAPHVELARDINAMISKLGRESNRSWCPSPLLVRQEFAIIGHHDAVTLGIFYLLNVHFKVDGAHDAITEHLMDERFNGGAVDLRNLMESVDEWVHGHRTV